MRKWGFKIVMDCLPTQNRTKVIAYTMYWIRWQPRTWQITFFDKIWLFCILNGQKTSYFVCFHFKYSQLSRPDTLFLLESANLYENMGLSLWEICQKWLCKKISLCQKNLYIQILIVLDLKNNFPVRPYTSVTTENYWFIDRMLL